MPTKRDKFLALLALLALMGIVWSQPWAVKLRQRISALSGPELTTEILRQYAVLPAGFEISVYDAGSAGGRMLRLTPEGDLLVSHPGTGEIVLLHRDADGDGHPDGRQILLKDLDRPHGMDVSGGWLYVGETGAVGRVRFDSKQRVISGNFERLLRIPDGGGHWSRSVRVGPDGWLYVSVGSSCNVCIESEPQRAALLRVAPDGSHSEIFATGLRNTVGYDWQPGTGDLYGTDNGRDMLGDDFPPCELNKLASGQFYGWPYANGDRVPDPDFGAAHADKVAASVSPAFSFRAHNAPLGMTFLRSTNWPDDYRNAAIVALHGSWNRSHKDGFKVVALQFQHGKFEARDFVTGFLQGDDVRGRPVDIAEDPAGAIYVSDDYTGSIYRVTRTPRP